MVAVITYTVHQTS